MYCQHQFNSQKRDWFHRFRILISKPTTYINNIFTAFRKTEFLTQYILNWIGKRKKNTFLLLDSYQIDLERIGKVLDGFVLKLIIDGVVNNPKSIGWERAFHSSTRKNSNNSIKIETGSNPMLKPPNPANKSIANINTLSFPNKEWTMLLLKWRKSLPITLRKKLFQFFQSQTTIFRELFQAHRLVFFFF